MYECLYSYFCVSYSSITLVSGAFTILNFLSTSISVILASMAANRMPMQDLGPLPKGMKALVLMEDFWDLLNLQRGGGEE